MIKRSEFDLLVTKFGLVTKSGDHLFAWLEHDGKVIVRTRRSHQKGGDLPMQHSIRQQLKLSEDQLRDAIQCSLDRDGYIAILRSKGLL
jgi:hypothetical protein